MSHPKTILITGCSEGGIGAALAHEFHRRGLQVFATARNVEKMASLTSVGITTFALDTTSAESINAAVDRVKKETSTDTNNTGTIGGLDILINNAGVQHILPFLDMTVPQVQHLINTNVIAVMAVTHAFLPLLIASKGVIASVGSINEVMAPVFQATYNASKAAIHVWGNTLRTELKPLGVRVVTLNTGAVRTKLFENEAKRIQEEEGQQEQGDLLPEGSPYKPLEKSIREREFLRLATWMEAENYAKEVADELLRKEPKRTVWKGGNALFGWLLSVFGWEGLLEGMFLKHNGLDKIQG